jgi:small-conductance mechanosensitive channel
MSEEHGSDVFGSMFDALNGVIERAGQGFERRIGSLEQSWTGLTDLLTKVATATGGIDRLLLLALLIGAATYAMFSLSCRLLRRRLSQAGLMMRILHVLVGFLVGATAGILLAHLVQAGPSAARATLSIIAVATALAATMLALQTMLIGALSVSADHQGALRTRRFVLQLNTVIGYAVAGAGLLAILRTWGANGGVRDLAATGLVAAPATLALMAVAFANRRTLASLVAGAKPRSRRRAWLARNWSAILIAVFGLTFITLQLAQTLGTQLPAVAIIATLAAVIALPFVDRLLKLWTEAGRGKESMSVVRLAGRMTVRPALLAIVGALLGASWLGPLLSGQGAGFTRYAYLALTLATLGLAAAFCWNLISLLAARAMQQDDDAIATDEESLTPRTRFQTLAPLLAGVGRWIVMTLAGLSALLVLGINVWPIVTGLSVFGIAIGFGSQALVKDVVSGVFFLIDDAFRQGEYIETSGAKGVVEKISIRSVSLRHQRGALATIPYGAIGRIQNFSRDWVVEKLLFRVALDTDVEAVRKLFKKIGQDLAGDPELAADLMEPFKSQGIAELEDGTLIVRGKFKAKAGRQHMIRRKVLAAVHRAFQDNGIRAVPKPLDAAKAA